MNRRIAFDNRLCYERDVLRAQAIHHHKLETILPTCVSPSKVYLDDGTPTPYAHVSLNHKRVQMERERHWEIYQENQRLAGKMEHIMNRQENATLAMASASNGDGGSAAMIATAPPTTPGSMGSVASPRSCNDRRNLHTPAFVHMPGIRLDAHQQPLVDCHLSPEYCMGRGNACKKSSLVNKQVQRRQQARIDEENRRMKQRLQAQKPFYNSRQWDSEYQQSARKFRHVHQDGTVGYLPPKPSTSQFATTRSPLSRRIKTRELPVLRAATTSNSEPHERLPRALRSPRSGAYTETEHRDRNVPDITDCGACVLLEATTRLGIEIVVEELQVELCDPDVGIIHPADRGLLIRARYGDDIRGECAVTLTMLELVAQEIDDVEMMIKLETVSSRDGMVNIPRLSVLLTEDELHTLLLRLVQTMNMQVREDIKQIAITSRLAHSTTAPADTDPRVTNNAITAPPCHAIARPKTCPSAIACDSSHCDAIDEQEDEDAPVSIQDAVDDEQSTCSSESTASTTDMDLEQPLAPASAPSISAAPPAVAPPAAASPPVEAASDPPVQPVVAIPPAEPSPAPISSPIQSPRQELAQLLNAGRRRAGMRIDNAFFLTHYWYDPTTSELRVTRLTIHARSSRGAAMSMKLTLSAAQVAASLQRLQQQLAPPEQVAWDYVACMYGTYPLSPRIAESSSSSLHPHPPEPVVL